MKRKVSSLLWGTLLCLPMLLASCNEKDNALEQIVNQPNLEGIQKALYKNAEIKIEYTVEGTSYTATLTNAGTIEDPKYEVVGDYPTEVTFNPAYELVYEEPYLTFRLLHVTAAPAGTRTDDETVEPEGPEPIPDGKLALLVVRFNTSTNQYDVYAIPQFDFKVISINGANMEVEDASKNNKATIKLAYEDGDGVHPAAGLEMKVGLNGITTWADLDKAYDNAGIGVFAALHNDAIEDAVDDIGTMAVDLSDYMNIYSTGSIHKWKFLLKDNELTDFIKSTENVTSDDYLAIDEMTRVLIPCYETATMGRSVLVDMLALAIPTGSPTWKDIAAAVQNKDLIKVVTDRSKTSGRERIVCKPGVVNSIDPESYFGLFKGLSRTRENADNEYVPGGSYKFYDLSDWVKSADIDWTPPVTSR